MDEDETIINFDRMTLVAERVLELNEFNTSSFMEEITLMPLLHNRLKQVSALIEYFKININNYIIDCYFIIQWII